MRICRIISFILISGMALSCQKVSFPEGGSGQSGSDPVTAKWVNSPEHADHSKLIFQTTEAPDELFLKELKESGLGEVKHLFNIIPENAERCALFNLDRWFIASLYDTDLETAAERLSVLPQVKKIEFNKILNSEIQSRPSGEQISMKSTSATSPVSGFNDPMFSKQWALCNDGTVSSHAYTGGDVNVKDAWRIATPDPELVVAIIDEAVMYTHPDLEQNMWKNADEIPDNGVDDDKNGYIDDVYGYDFVNDTGHISWDRNVDSDHYDSGHGSHVAGIVSAVNGNGIGISSVAGGTGKGDGVRLMSCQIFSANRSTIEATVRAFQYAADNGAVIAQSSFGYPAQSYTSDQNYRDKCGAELDAVLYFESVQNYPALQGGISIFAAGNDASDVACYPGAYRDFISVTSVGPDYLPAYYTNYSYGCSIAAPGGDQLVPPGTPRHPHWPGGILSTISDFKNPSQPSYDYLQGTSQATPMVSSIAALGLSHARHLGKNYTLPEFKSLLLSSVRNIDDRLSGSKPTENPEENVTLSRYKGKMGTGVVDAWKMLMLVEGVPSVIVKIGEVNSIALADYFGGGANGLTFLGVDIDEETRQSLGIEGDPLIRFGFLKLKTTKLGAGKIRIRAIAGGDRIGTESQLGGMEISQEISVISRSYKSVVGGWL